MRAGIVVMALTGALAIPCLAAEQGISFEHKDWQLACDNTGTCRAAGYQADDAGPAISLLLVRAAGPRQEPTAQVQLGSYAEEDTASAAGVKSLTIKVGERTIGTVAIDSADQTGTLSRTTLAALLPTLQSASVITWVSGKHAWKLSTAGASAVLLKMDEAQGRIGTVGAIVRKGSQPEDGVPKAGAIPVVVAAAVPKDSASDVLLAPAQRPVLLTELRRIARHDDCPGLYDGVHGEKTIDLELHRLSGTKLLASVTCASYAYNESGGYWVINARPPFAPVMAAGPGANEYDNGEIVSVQKGRGIADCISSATWTWNGVQFMQTARTTSGLCRAIAPGGGWDLPTWVTTVKKSSAAK